MRGLALEVGTLATVNQRSSIRKPRRPGVSAQMERESPLDQAPYLLVAPPGTMNPQVEEDYLYRGSRLGVSARMEPEFVPNEAPCFLVAPPWTVSTQQVEKDYFSRWSRLSVSARTQYEIPTNPVFSFLVLNSTLPQEYSIKVEQEFERLLLAAKEETFEDGMESNFSKGLNSLIRKYGNAAIDILTRFILTEAINPEVASETLRWVGYIDHLASYQYRRWLLERTLFCSSARVRDGAILGLASLDDPHAIPHLKRAIQRERYSELRRDMEQVLTQLENNISALYSENHKKE